VSLSEHPDWFGRVWSRAEEEIAQGRRVFVVCSAIDKADADPDGSEDDVPVTGVEELAAQLRTHPQLGDRRIGIVHGRLASDEKDRVMTQFQQGELDLLVATTVIEVGVDVPQASTMIVMDADRFGISQLHQLRGRVGRGELPGVCLLVTHVHPETLARQRLDAVASTTDGFELARIDMELRREGDVLGSSQSGGRSGLKLLRVSTDGDLIEAARHQARDLLNESADLSQYPSLQSAVDELLAGQEADYLDRS
jgi:RecG-like helicase